MCYSTNIGRHFARISWDFVKIFRDFFQILGKLRLLEVRLHPFTPASYTTALQQQ